MTYYPDDHPAFDQPEFNPEPPDEKPDDDPDQGYDRSDPKHPTYASRMSDVWDNRDKGA